MPVHMLHIGKTGGSAVKEALRPVVEERQIRLYRHHVRLADVPPGEPVFFALRDPIDRFVSGFLSRQRKGRPRYDIEWSPAERLAFGRYRTACELAEDIGRSSEAAAAMSAISHVRQRLRDWFDGLGEIERRGRDIVLILFQERLEADFEELKRRLGLPSGLRLPSDDVGAHRTPPGLDRGLSPLARRNLERWYAEDIALVEALRARRG